MIQEIKMPSAGQTTDEATIVKVNIKVGDTVKRGDELLEAETDKAILPVESFTAGQVFDVLVSERDTVTAGTVLAVIGKHGEQYQGGTAPKAEAAAPAAAPEPEPAPAAVQANVRALVKKDIFRDAGIFSFQKIQAGKAEVTTKLVGGVQYLLKKQGVEVVSGEAVLKSGRVVSCGGKDYQGRYVVIATGSQPMMLPIPGRELCIDSTGALNLRNLPRSMVVMGGGVIGLEQACAFAAYGTEVTIVELMPELVPREQKEAVRVVLKELKRQGIRLLTGAKMLRVEKSGAGLRAVYEQDGTEGSVDAEQVLMVAGRKPNFTGIDAGALGLAMNGKFIAVDNHQRTSLEGVYAIGDVVGGYQLAHAAYAEGEAALADMLGKNEPYGNSSGKRAEIRNRDASSSGSAETRGVPVFRWRECGSVPARETDYFKRRISRGWTAIHRRSGRFSAYQSSRLSSIRRGADSGAAPSGRSRTMVVNTS